MGLQNSPTKPTVFAVLPVCGSRCELPAAATAPCLPACCHAPSPCYDGVPLL